MPRMSFASPAFAASVPFSRAVPYRLAPQALALAMFALCAFSPAVLNDADTWSHIATGRWILAHLAVPHVDPFTFSVPGKAWTAHEWLAEVLLALAYGAGGFKGVVLLTGAAAATAIFVVARAMARDLGGPALAAVGVLALMLISPGLLARPHILALPIFALWTDALARSRDRAPPVAVALLMALWANLHGGFIFGLALIVPFAGDAVLSAAAERRQRLARDWAVFALVSLIAALINPFGIEALLFPVRLLDLQILSQIGEWGPESFATPNPLEISFLGLLAFALTRPLRMPPFRLATLIGLLYMSLSHARHELLFAVVAPMLLARPIAQALGAPAILPWPNRRLALISLVAAAAALSAVRLFLPAPASAEFEATRQALAALPPGLERKPVLNGYGFGGYLIFEGVRPYVDGRADLFGDEFLRDYSRVARGERGDVEALLAKDNIDWTMFAPDEGVVDTMDALPGWRRLYTSPRVVIHARAP